MPCIASSALSHRLGPQPARAWQQAIQLFLAGCKAAKLHIVVGTTMPWMMISSGLEIWSIVYGFLHQNTSGACSGADGKLDSSRHIAAMQAGSCQNMIAGSLDLHSGASRNGHQTSIESALGRKGGTHLSSWRGMAACRLAGRLPAAAVAGRLTGSMPMAALATSPSMDCASLAVVELRAARMSDWTAYAGGGVEITL